MLIILVVFTETSKKIHHLVPPRRMVTVKTRQPPQVKRPQIVQDPSSPSTVNRLRVVPQESFQDSQMSRNFIKRFQSAMTCHLQRFVLISNWILFFVGLVVVVVVGGGVVAVAFCCCNWCWCWLRGAVLLKAFNTPWTTLLPVFKIKLIIWIDFKLGTVS